MAEKRKSRKLTAEDLAASEELLRQARARIAERREIERRVDEESASAAADEK